MRVWITDELCRYLEQRFGEGTVRKLNGCLRGKDYDEEKLFGECCDGHKVEDLWYLITARLPFTMVDR